MTEQLTASRFQVPAAVQESQARRDAARNNARVRPCAGDGGTCRLPAKHSCTRYGGAWCTHHWVTFLGLPLPATQEDAS